jgi:hypothetical protein
VDALERLDEVALAAILRVLTQHFGYAYDGVERRPQLMAHVRKELTFGAAGLLGLLLGLAQLDLGPLARCDVADRSRHAVHPADLVADADATRQHPTVGAVTAAQPELDVQELALAFQVRSQLGQVGLEIVGVQIGAPIGRLDRFGIGLEAGQLPEARRNV